MNISNNLVEIIAQVGKNKKKLGFDIFQLKKVILHSREALLTGLVSEKEFEYWGRMIPDEVDIQNWYSISSFNREEIVISKH